MVVNINFASSLPVADFHPIKSQYSIWQPEKIDYIGSTTCSVVVDCSSLESDMVQSLIPKKLRQQVESLGQVYSQLSLTLFFRPADKLSSSPYSGVAQLPSAHDMPVPREVLSGAFSPDWKVCKSRNVSKTRTRRIHITRFEDDTTK